MNYSPIVSFNFKTYLFIVITLLLSTSVASAQQADSTFIGFYPQKMWVTGYVSTSNLQVTNGSKTYIPNYPINAGVGIGIRNTVVNVILGTSIAPLKGKDYGKTKAVDLQVHNYGRHFLMDVFYQRYRGFYTEDRSDISLYPDLSVQQIGAEGTYLFNGNRFSAKAAFEQSEMQLLSAGSILVGAGAYWHRITPDSKQQPVYNQTFDNMQFGVNGGYAYSWVVDSHWLITGMATIGANFGNEIESLKDGKLKIYPTAIARAASTYRKEDWSVSFSMLINNKVTYPSIGNSFNITSVGMQISYVKQLNKIFRKKQ